MTADRPPEADVSIACSPTTADRPQTLSSASSSTDRAAAAQEHQRRSSSETLRLYAGDWAVFEDWCRQREFVSLPAKVSTVAEFLTEAGATLSAGALTRRAAAIADQHRRRGLASPAADLAVRAVLRLARLNSRPRRPASTPSATLIQMASHCPRDLPGIRDRALLLLAASGLSRAAMVGLDFERIRFTASGAELSPEASGAEASRESRFVISRGTNHAVCPVQALRDWLDASDTQFGPVFRKIDRWGTLEHHRLGTDAIRRILARRAHRRPRLQKPGAVRRRRI